MSDCKDKPEDLNAAYEHLVLLCSKGMLFEAEAWMQSGHSAARPPDVRHCPLAIAAEKGFHSLVELLLRYDCNADQKLDAIEQAARSGDLEIVRLLVEAGAPVERLSFWYLDEVVNRKLIEYLLDHGLDLSREDGLAQMLIYRRIKPLLGLFLQGRARFPAWEVQAAKVLCEFVRKSDLKWISLMIWAKADPLLRVGPISEDQCGEVEDVYLESAAEIALIHRNLEIFRMLKISPTPEQAQGFLDSIWSAPDLEVLELLFDAGADPNALPPGRGSLLHRILVSFGWNCDSGFARQGSRKEVEMISWLIRKCAKWVPLDRDGSLDSLRRQFYRDGGELAVEVVRLLDAGEACDKELLRAFVDKPKMRGWVRFHEPELFGRLFL